MSISVKNNQYYTINCILYRVFHDLWTVGDFLGLYDKKVHIKLCPILDGYGVMGIF